MNQPSGAERALPRLDTLGADLLTTTLSEAGLREL
jgi:hypothetical protein